MFEVMLLCAVQYDDDASDIIIIMKTVTTQNPMRPTTIQTPDGGSFSPTLPTTELINF